MDQLKKIALRKKSGLSSCLEEKLNRVILHPCVSFASVKYQRIF